MQVDFFNWNPYHNLENVPDNFSSKMEISLAIFPIFKNEFCLVHTPHVAPQQFNLSDVMVNQMEPWVVVNNIDFSYHCLKGTQGMQYLSHFPEVTRCVLIILLYKCVFLI